MSEYNFNNTNNQNNKFKFSIILIICFFLVAGYIYYDKNLQDKVLKNTGLMVSKLEINNEKDTSLVKEQILVNKEEVKLESKNKVLKPISIPKKKQNFLDLMVEPINEVYLEFDILYKEILSNPNDNRIPSLMKKYKVKTTLDLLKALKPHPKSIALAQAAMESAWATSRFFVEAKNIFGVWSVNKNEPRVPALVKRGDRTVYVRKYQSIKESIRSYYITLSRSKAFKEFRELNYEKEFANPYELTKKLDKYSEKGEEYGKELNSMISYNKFIRFDEKFYANEKTTKEVK